MDSLTQIALGAAVGEALLGHKVGYRAALWGAVAGTIPDLDVAAYPLLDEAQKLGWHRGYSHSLVFTAAFAPILGWIIHKIHRRHGTWRDWTLVAFLGLFTHVLLDSFTVYGTQLFMPFSNYQVGFNSISIIDPMYTLPLLAGVLAALFMRRSSSARRIVNYLGLAFSTGYLLFTVGVKMYVDNRVHQSLVSEDLAYHRFMTAPTLFNSILWRATAESTDGYYVGYYSLLDSDPLIDFTFVPRRDTLLSPVEDQPAVSQLLWFSNGYYTVEKSADSLLFHDLRFGELGFGKPGAGKYVFTWQIVNPGSGQPARLVRLEPSVEEPGDVLAQLADRIQGD
jgi:inner membrane protein